MPISDEQRKEIIPELDMLVNKAEGLKKELNYLIDHFQLYNEKDIWHVLNEAGTYKLVASLQSASDALKRANVGRIQGYLTSWYHFRVDLDVDAPADPVYESINYQGRDTWEVIMSTPTHGREKIIVHSDAATWEQVYSVDPA